MTARSHDVVDWSESLDGDTGAKRRHEAPTSWRPGFVEVGRGWLTEGGFATDPGDPTIPRAPLMTARHVVDLDGDGQQEWVASSLPVVGPSVPPQVRVWRVDWAAGVLSRAPELERLVMQGANDPVSGFVDLTGDGWPVRLGTGGPMGVRLGSAAGWSGVVGELELPPDTSILFTVAPFDVDEDGWLDVVVGQRRCVGRTINVFRAAGGGRFHPIPQIVGAHDGEAFVDALLPLEDPGFGRSTGLYPVALACDQARPFPGFYDRVRADGAGLPSLVPREAIAGTPHWQAVPEGFGAAISQTAPMGASLEDLDGDGRGELLVTLGSGYIGVFRNIAGEWHDVTLRAGLLRSRLVDRMYLPWSLVHPDLDLDGRPDVVVTYGDDDTSFQLVRDFQHPTVA